MEHSAPPVLPGQLRPHEIQWQTLAEDTDPAAEAIQLEILRSLPPWRKLEMVQEAILASDALALAGLRSRYPEATAQEIRRRLMGLLHGEDIATRAFGPLEESLHPAKGQ